MIKPDDRKRFYFKILPRDHRRLKLESAKNSITMTSYSNHMLNFIWNNEDTKDRLDAYIKKQENGV